MSSMLDLRHWLSFPLLISIRYLLLFHFDGIEEEGKTTVGQAADTDTLVASANAYLSALNKMIIKRKKTAPIEHETQKVKGI